MEDDSYTLETGICRRLTEPGHNDEEMFSTPHTVQVLSWKQIPSPAGNSAQDRFRVILSDGQYYIQAMLATQLNHLITSGDIGKGAVIVLEKLSCNYVQDKRLLIVLQVRILEKVGDRLGNPVNINESVPPTPAVAPPTSHSSRPSAKTPAPAAAPSKPQQQSQASSSTKQRSVLPIEALSPYQNNWTIKARCTQKGEIKTWSNQRGEGKLFNMTLMDETAEIRATAFNQVAEDLYQRIEEGKVYYVSKARVNMAKKKFSPLTNDYELSLEKHTEFEECLDTVNLPQVRFSFVALSNLQELAKDSTCDVLGVLKEAGEMGEITAKATNRQVLKRELKVVDESGYAINVTLWGKQAESFHTDEENPIIAFKGVRVGDFNGRSLSMVGTSMMMINPDIHEAHALRGWYDSAGSGQTFQAHSRSDGGGGGGAIFKRSELMRLADVATMEVDDGGSIFCCQASTVHIKPDKISYEACHTPGCNKKVIQDGDSWRCDKWNSLHATPNHRYIMSMVVSDASHHAWLQGFNDVGEALFSMSANELINIRESDEEQFQIVMHKAMHEPYNFVVRAKLDTYNDTSRIRYGVIKIQNLNYREEMQAQLDLLETMLPSYQPSY